MRFLFTIYSIDIWFVAKDNQIYSRKILDKKSKDQISLLTIRYSYKFAIYQKNRYYIELPT